MYNQNSIIELLNFLAKNTKLQDKKYKRNIIILAFLKFYFHLNDLSYWAES